MSVHTLTQGFICSFQKRLLISCNDTLIFQRGCRDHKTAEREQHSVSQTERFKKITIVILHKILYIQFLSCRCSLRCENEAAFFFFVFLRSYMRIMFISERQIYFPRPSFVILVTKPSISCYSCFFFFFPVDRRLFSFCHLERNGSHTHFCKESWCMENKN